MSLAPIQLSPGAMVAGSGNQASANQINGIDLLSGDADSVTMTWATKTDKQKQYTFNYEVAKALNSDRQIA